MGLRIDRVYTRTGDEGKTALIGGSRVKKSHSRIEAYGTVDELNALVGILRAHVRVMPGPKDLGQELDVFLQEVQQDLFNMGADLATPLANSEKKSKGQPQAKLNAQRVGDFEKQMDRWQQNLEPLTSFVLPSGGLVTAHCHLCRTVTRRAERLVVALASEEAILGPALIYLNRLSDTFFVMGRHVAKRLGEPEFLWKY